MRQPGERCERITRMSTGVHSTVGRKGPWLEASRERGHLAGTEPTSCSSGGTVSSDLDPDAVAMGPTVRQESGAELDKLADRVEAQFNDNAGNENLDPDAVAMGLTVRQEDKAELDKLADSFKTQFNDNAGDEKRWGDDIMDIYAARGKTA